MDKSLLDAVLSFPKDFLVISGGEPSCAKDEAEYIIKRNKGPLRMNTNLTMWSRDELIDMQSNGVTFSVSVPSMIRSDYEAVTGADTYDRLLENLEYISKMSKMTIIMNAITSHSSEKTVMMLAGMGFWRFTLQPMIPNGVDYDMSGMMHEAERIYRNHRNLDIKLLCRTIDSQMPVNHECGAGRDRVVILSNGDVVPCACYDAPILGNVLDDDYQRILENGERYFDSFKEEERAICKGWLCRDGEKSCFRGMNTASRSVR